MERVRKQVTDLSGRTREWKIEVRDGDPSQLIARTARELKARVIAIGLGHHQLLDRLFGGETALHVLRQARTPVLAVPPDFDSLPERLVIATDFSPESVSAARIALRLFDTVTSVHVVHVAPRLDLHPDAFAAWMTVFRDGVGPAFDRLRHDLEMASGVEVTTETLNGKPSRELLEYAEKAGADLIVTGSSGAGVVDRILVGSTATGVLRGARCAVPAVPTSGASRATPWNAAASSGVDRQAWPSELEGFSKRNLGRLASLEVDDPDLGAQAQERDYPFLGASWDHHDERIQVMLGDFNATGRHLTRSIGGVTAVDILRDDAGRDRVLRIQHGDGQTMLTLSR
jgi:nucleotide-binding universal stress UspA family protein